MEDTLGALKQLWIKESSSLVLILVLMEDTLGGLTNQMLSSLNLVLILVLMEDTLGDMPY